MALSTNGAPGTYLSVLLKFTAQFVYMGSARFREGHGACGGSAGRIGKAVDAPSGSDARNEVIAGDLLAPDAIHTEVGGGAQVPDLVRRAPAARQFRLKLRQGGPDDDIVIRVGRTVHVPRVVIDLYARPVGVYCRCHGYCFARGSLVIEVTCRAHQDEGHIVDARRCRAGGVAANLQGNV